MSQEAGTGTEVVNPSAANFFEQYGERTQQRSIVGKLLKFSKGDYLAGQDEEEVPAGTKLVFNMDNFLVGWMKWEDQKPVDTRMGLLSEGFVPSKRKDLGDDDDTQWEVDEQSGKPRDPWQSTNQVLLKDVGKKRKDSDDGLYTFATSSFGGISNLGKLCKAYGGAMRQHPDEYPVVELGVEAYNHPNKQFGRIKNPTFTIVGWEKKALFAEPAAAPAQAQIEAPKASGKTKK